MRADATSVSRPAGFRASWPSAARCRIGSRTIPSTSTATSTSCSSFTASAGPGWRPRSSRQAAFHREFAAQALAQGWLRLWFLEVAGTAVAALYGFRFAGAESAYQAGRDPAFESGQVGFVLLLHAIREAITDGMAEYRLLRGGAAYKNRFATSDPGIETYGLPRGRSARLVLAVALAARGRSLGLRRLLDRHVRALLLCVRPRRIPGHDRPCRHISRHDCAGADERVRADPKASQDHGARPDRGAALDGRALDLPVRFGLQLARGGHRPREAITSAPTSTSEISRYGASLAGSCTVVKRNSPPRSPPTSARRRCRGRQSDLILCEQFEYAFRIMGVDRENVRPPPAGRLRRRRRL